MYVLTEKRTAYFDVDGTLIDWECSELNDNIIEISSIDGIISVLPIQENIDYLINLKSIGWNIVVWSQGGSDHAERVIQALSLTPYVDVILPKPQIYVDDLEFNDMGIKRHFKGEKNGT